MSQNFTQPEEVDHALMEMSWQTGDQGMKASATTNDHKRVSPLQPKVSRAESADKEEGAGSGRLKA
jgi:hypothetical protein